MQKKEAQGDDDSLPDEVTSNLLGLTKEACEQLTVFKIKKVRSLIDEAIEANNKALGDHEKVSYIHQKKGGLEGGPGPPHFWTHNQGLRRWFLAAYLNYQVVGRNNVDLTPFPNDLDGRYVTVQGPKFEVVKSKVAI